jgi:hypothetical protein
MKCSCWMFTRTIPVVDTTELVELETPQKVVVYRCGRCGEVHSEEAGFTDEDDLTPEYSDDQLRCWLLQRFRALMRSPQPEASATIAFLAQS